MVTPTFTDVLLQIAIMLESRAKQASPPVFNHKTSVEQMDWWRNWSGGEAVLFTST